MDSKFECKKYGECCRNIRAGVRLPRFDNPFVRSFTESGQLGLGISDWEYDTIIEKAGAFGFSPKIIPFIVLLSADDGIVVVNWSFNYNVCPFLVNDRCVIYKDRPGLCRAYPVSIWYKRGGREVRAESSCRCFKESLPDESSEETRTYEEASALEIFGDNFVQAMVQDRQIDFVVGIVSDMAKKGLIKPNRMSGEEMHEAYSRRHYRFTEFQARNGYLKRAKFLGELRRIESRTYSDILANR